MGDAETTLTGIGDHLDGIKLQHEGLRDDARLNINPDSLIEVRADTEFLDERVRRCDVARDALRALIEHGYPNLPVREVSDEVIANLQTQAAGINAALGRFSSNRAKTLATTAGATEPKPPLAARAPKEER